MHNVCVCVFALISNYASAFLLSFLVCSILNQFFEGFSMILGHYQTILFCFLFLPFLSLYLLLFVFSFFLFFLYHSTVVKYSSLLLILSDHVGFSRRFPRITRANAT